MRRILLVALATVSLILSAARLRAQKPAALSEAEEDRLRDAQDPSDRITVYLSLAESRLEQFEDFRAERYDPKYANGKYLDEILDQYIDLDDELKDWIDDQYQRRADMRRGLRALLETAPQQLAALRKIQQTPDAYQADYKDSLQDAIDDLNDTLNGATQALADQEKQFAAEKRQEKAEAQQTKETEKEARKREKEEKKLRKKEEKLQKKNGVPNDDDDQN